MLAYTRNQWSMLFLATIFSAIATASQTVAFQSDNTTLIMIVANIGLVYFFLADTFVFNETFTWIELVSVVVITVVVLSITLFKIEEKKKQA